MKKYFFILFSFFLLSNDCVFATEPDESYEEESEETEEEEDSEPAAEGEDSEESDVNAENSANDNNMREQARKVQQERQEEVRQTVDDVLGIDRTALSEKQQQEDRKENKKLKKDVEKLRNEVDELKKLVKDTQKKAKDAQKLANRLKKQQKESAEPEKETPKEKPKPKKKRIVKKKRMPKKAKPAKKPKIYTVKQNRIPEYENYLKDFMPNYLNTQPISRSYDVNSLLQQSQKLYPTHRYGKPSSVNFWNPSSFGAKSRVTVLKDNGISKYTIKDSLLSNSFQKSQLPQQMGIEEMKNLYKTTDSKKTYFKGKCSCKKKKKMSNQPAGSIFENFFN